MDLNILKTIMNDFRVSGYSECRLSEAGITLELKRIVPEPVPAGVSVSGEKESMQMSGAGNTAAGLQGGAGLYAGNAAGANAGAGLNAGAEGVQNAGADTADAAVVKAQMAGTFYTSAKPGEAPYVKEGSRVAKGDTLGLLEAMKVISEITAPVSGTVESVMLEDAAFAEFDAPLFRIRTAG